MAGRELVGTERGLAGSKRRALAAQDPLADIVAGQLSPETKRAYRQDLSHLLAFLLSEQTVRVLAPGDWRAMSRAERSVLLSEAWQDRREALRLLLEVDRADLIAFRAYLKETLGLAAGGVNRRLSGVRSILRELHLRGLRPDNPGVGVRGLRSNGASSSAVGLSPAQAGELLAAPDGNGLPGLRDAALLAVMVRNGLRASEVVGLRVGDLGEDQGFRVATIRGKGEQVRAAKLSGPTWEAVKAWLDAADRWTGGEEAPVFVPLRKHGRKGEARWLAWERPMTTQALAQIVAKWAKAALPEELAARVHPHSLRHTFATIALEAGASLRRVQYAMGHVDPRTTERYDRARENLADNAADYVTKALNGGQG